MKDNLPKVKEEEEKERINWKRKGRFILTTDFVYSVDKELLFKVFDEVFIVRTENDFFADIYIYNAVSDHFVEVGEGELIPTYEFRIDAETQNIEWIRLADSDSYRWRRFKQEDKNEDKNNGSRIYNERRRCRKYSA